MAAGNLQKHLEFSLAVFNTSLLYNELANIRIDTSRSILAVQATKTRGKSMFSMQLACFSKAVNMSRTVKN